MASNLSKHIGTRIQAARKAKGLTQEQLAELVSKSIETISNAERGAVAISIDSLEAIAKTLDTNLEFYFSDYRSKRRSSQATADRVELELIGDKLDHPRLKLLLEIARSIQEAKIK